ncbi:enhancer of split mgamma protein-like [Dreissena polymorpha]|uniref:enhancer of split mgamma protein-like n=1 Tax=Dreissena polymorpha TaxID=45954 RepID=UPI002263AEEA|nr:enhancer of split mgamma protein-like [Dreissena polymorpha]
MAAIKHERHDTTRYLRKIRKPLVEKQRRERMNKSIDQLKLLIADTIKEQAAPMTRVDKADILDLTVFHLTTVQHHQRSATMATEAAAYNAGFKDCFREVMTYLSACKVTDVSSAYNLSAHLHQTLTEKIRFNPNKGKASGRTANNFISTPARNNDVSFITSPSLYTPNLSPIVSNSSINGFLRTKMCTTEPGNTRDDMSFRYDSSTDSCYSSMDVSMATSFDATSGSEDVVAIGNGQDDKVGHVIRDSFWRPFEL